MVNGELIRMYNLGDLYIGLGRKGDPNIWPLCREYDQGVVIDLGAQNDLDSTPALGLKIGFGRKTNLGEENRRLETISISG